MRFKELRKLKFLTTGSRVVEYYKYDHIPVSVTALVAWIDYFWSGYPDIRYRSNWPFLIWTSAGIKTFAC